MLRLATILLLPLHASATECPGLAWDYPANVEGATLAQEDLRIQRMFQHQRSGEICFAPDGYPRMDTCGPVLVATCPPGSGWPTYCPPGMVAKLEWDAKLPGNRLYCRKP